MSLDTIFLNKYVIVRSYDSGVHFGIMNWNYERV